MSRRAMLFAAGLLVLLTVLTVLASHRPGAESSALSSTPGGLLVARRYLELRGTPVDLLDEPFETSTATPTVLVVAFPWQRMLPDEEFFALHAQVRGGATLLYAFSGDSFALGERQLLNALGLAEATPRGRAPLRPAAFRAFAAENWTLAPELTGAAPITVRAPRRLPQAPAESTIFFRSPDGLPVVFSYPIGRGRVFVLPAEVLSNAGLPRGGSLDLLESLRQRTASRWTFDEFHHGLSAAASPVQAGSRRVLDLYLLQLALLYGLALLALVRRFGPAWSDPPQVMGSAGAFLVGLGALHDRLGHHPAAARLLVDRARELSPHLTFTAPTAMADGSAQGLVTLARAIARHQRQPRRTR